jgi:HemY protein
LKALFWILSAIALAVGLTALALRSGSGYVQIVWPPHRIEVSLVLAAVTLLAGFVLTYVSLRLIAAMVAMPRQVRAYREARKQRKGTEALTSALHEFFSGRYARAEKAASTAMELSGEPGLAAMLAARAAHELRAPERRDTYLARGAAHLSEGDILKVITEADLMLKERRAADALTALQALPQKHTAGLRLELRALQLAKEWEKSLTVIDQLEKRKVYDAAQARELRTLAWVEHLKKRASDIATLDEAWRKVPDAQKREPRVVRAAAEGYSALDAAHRAAEMIERSLDRDWDSDLARLYGDCAASDTPRSIEHAERWLKAHPDDAALLLTLSKLCARQNLWGKARNYVDASLSVEPTLEAHLAAAQLHEQLNETDAAQRHYRRSLDLALAKLEGHATDNKLPARRPA